MKTNEKGFSAIELVIIIVVVGLVILGGWYLWHRNQDTDQKNKASSTSQTTQEQSSESSSSEAKYLAIEKWAIEVLQPKDHTATLGSVYMGQDVITGATSGVNLYLAEYDSHYTCDMSSGETYKALLGTIQQFPLDSTIESNSKNKPAAIKAVGEHKYGFYAPQVIADCYDDAQVAQTVQAIVDQFVSDFSIQAINS